MSSLTPLAVFRLLLPDFALIILGAALARIGLPRREAWAGIEQLVYFVLFPVLLFHSLNRAPLPFIGAAPLGALALLLTAMLALAAALSAHWPGLRTAPQGARLHASGAQIAFRFNSYVALALAERLGNGIPALIALVVAVCVPLCNLGAVFYLTRFAQKQERSEGLRAPPSYWREIARNPLIIGSLIGLTYKATGLPWGAEAAIVSGRLSQAALVLGLLAVGAGLQLGSLRQAPGFAALLLLLRHALGPLIAWTLLQIWPLPGAAALALMLFSALPTASSAYILAVRLGGDGAFTAGLISLSTLLAALTIPLALALAL